MEKTMRILTVSASPYLLVRNGRMNSDAIKHLKDQGHHVTSAVWHHDEGFFVPNEDGLSFFEDEDGNQICELYPFFPQSEQAESLLYEMMKKVQPDVVISIGDYKEISFIYAIKAMYPTLFKWVAVMTVDCFPINEEYKDRIEYADYVTSTSEFGWENLNTLCNIQGEFLPYGPDHSSFYSADKAGDRCTVFCSEKNSQASNLGALIKAMGIVQKSGSDVRCKLHTNLYDPGDYELSLLIDRYGASNVELPEYFVSIKDSISNEEMLQEYAQGDFMVDTSLKSATALSLLEGMASGLIPIGPNAGRVGEIISHMPEEFQLFIPHETFIGGKEEEYSLISIEGLAGKIIEIEKNMFNDPEIMKKASEAARNVALRFSSLSFSNRLVEIVEMVSEKENVMSLDTF
jgi:glycosyltransferase involved in cell wall biosynthesis